MNLPLKQTRKSNCGQTCVAMIAGISIEEAEKAVGHKTGTYAAELDIALRKYRYSIAGGSVYKTDKLTSNYCLVLIGWERRYRGKRVAGGKLTGGHWLVYAHGWFFDPTSGMLSATVPLGSRIRGCGNILKKKVK